MIPYNREFLVLTLPAPKRDMVRVQAGRGVKVNYLYYWSEAFRNPEAEGKPVAVRYEPLTPARRTLSFAASGSNATRSCIQLFAAALKKK